MLTVLLFFSQRPTSLTFCCAQDNDLYQIVARADPATRRFDKPWQAILNAPEGGGVLLLCGQPMGGDESIAHQKHLKLYVELPPDANANPLTTKTLDWERVIVTDDGFGPDLRRGRILSIGRQKISLVVLSKPIRATGQGPASKPTNPLLVTGRVAGFDYLAFGMPAHTDPLLWQDDDGWLLASAPLSNFITGRYAPSQPWKTVWRTILGKLGAGDLASRLRFTPAVAPSYSAIDRLPRNAEARASQRAANWFLHSHLLASPADIPTYDAADKWRDRVGPAPSGNGDGSEGILEGYSAGIDGHGYQPIRWYRRADCNAESSMALALAGGAAGQKESRNMLSYLLTRSIASQGPRANPKDPTYGLLGWSDTGTGPINYYGDDNARAVLGLIAAEGALKDNKWDDAILRCILANFRTTGVNGFRGDDLMHDDIERLGWQHFFNAQIVNMAPHFEAYNWACYLWAYAHTGYKPLLERTEKAIERTLSSGEQAWTWTNGLQQERARMLLPLAWLIRVDNTPKHRAWLDDMTRKVISHQAECGAIQEEIGDLSHGIAGPPRDNDGYGAGETPLIQENGDPLCDLLYTTNFAFLGLHEVAEATGDPAYKRAESKLADFLCRIQIRSQSHPELDGAWFRGFDFGTWDYWASSADIAWGTWSIETGWSVSWVTSVLAMRQRHVALWDIHAGFKPDLDIAREMLP